MSNVKVNVNLTPELEKKITAIINRDPLEKAKKLIKAGYKVTPPENFSDNDTKVKVLRLLTRAVEKNDSVLVIENEE